ncbi:unnamed protein product [Tenebrio molitor]|nr:unnamed protein product [Tenebrio molitor]
MEQWGRILFTNESRFHLTNKDGRSACAGRKGKVLQVRRSTASKIFFNTEEKT